MNVAILKLPYIRLPQCDKDDDDVDEIVDDDDDVDGGNADDIEETVVVTVFDFSHQCNG